MAKSDADFVRMTIGFHRELVRAIDRWRIEQTPVPSRAEAIRKLLGKALLSDTK